MLPQPPAPPSGGDTGTQVLVTGSYIAPWLVQTPLSLPLYSPPTTMTWPWGSTAEALYCGAYCEPSTTGIDAIWLQVPVA